MQQKLGLGYLMLSGIAALVFLPSLAIAQCGGETLFSCKTRGKLVEVCHDGDKISYAFGPKGAPEMQISSTMTELQYRPWDGIGIMMSDTVRFSNGDTSYEVWAGVEKMMDEAAPPPKWAGGVNVMKGEEVVAFLDCDAVPEVYRLDSLFDLKQAAGQCFEYESQSWKTQCSN